MRENLTPIWTPLYWHRRLLDNYIREMAPRFISNVRSYVDSPNIRILDIGCGAMPYRHYFEECSGSSYYGADIPCKDRKADVGINAETQRIKAGDASFEGVVHFQVLEHVAAYEIFINECWRVLKPGGAMFCTVPFAFEFHGVPSDYRRWTHEGLKFDLWRSGFRCIEVTPVEPDFLAVLSIVELFVANTLGYFWTKPIFLLANLMGFLCGSHAEGRIPLTNAVFCRKLSAAESK
jgi:SAM-dependent methyltransferase